MNSQKISYLVEDMRAWQQNLQNTQQQISCFVADKCKMEINI